MQSDQIKSSVDKSERLENRIAVLECNYAINFFRLVNLNRLKSKIRRVFVIYVRHDFLIYEIKKKSRIVEHATK